MNLEAINKLREETPGCKNVLHFNNAGASLQPKPVIDAIYEHQTLEYGRGGYEAADYAADKLKNFYHSVAKLLNAQSSEIAFIESATRAWDMAFYSLKFERGDHILTAKAEYVSNYIALMQVAKKTGARIEVVPDDEHGQISIQELENRITSRTKLIAITHIPTQGGLINPVEAVGRIAKQAGIFYLLDATQSAGQIPLDVQKIGCDALCATGRKFLRGPRGTGFLYVNKNVLEKLEPPFLDLLAANWITKDSYTIRPDARRFENWERNCANQIGLATAVDYALALGIDQIWKRIDYLATELRKQLVTIPEVTLEDLGLNKCGIVTFTVKGWSPVAVRNYLRERDINVSVSLQEDARLDLDERAISSLVRASVHYYNTIKEVENFQKKIQQMILAT